MKNRITSTEVFTSLIDTTDTVAVKFEADWCPDCKRMDFFMDDVLKDHSDLKLYEVDSDALAEQAEKYDVMGLPSILLFRNGEKTAHLHSAQAKTPEEVKAFLQEHL
ncbi:thioredoxin family protein [Salisediminibacterium beveridgei]|uniref:Thioredoxin n=1 Tax=Salisediminibacterium beveridgei TaxID=632773 RepID=A0A1D7QYJ3_9BACI|nr:thioredoxin family protein [Salisediminibacterium beveridgei]AOM84084.1 Thioredoxin [Salisediminibacterium beveridgei]